MILNYRYSGMDNLIYYNLLVFITNNKKSCIVVSKHPIACKPVGFQYLYCYNWYFANKKLMMYERLNLLPWLRKFHVEKKN